MAHTLLPGHVPLNDETMDRFSVGPDKNLYLDDKKVVTQDLFQSSSVPTLREIASFLSQVIDSTGNSSRHSIEIETALKTRKCLSE